jgi:hypothetical protein
MMRCRDTCEPRVCRGAATPISDGPLRPSACYVSDLEARRTSWERSRSTHHFVASWASAVRLCFGSHCQLCPAFKGLFLLVARWPSFIDALMHAQRSPTGSCLGSGTKTWSSRRRWARRVRAVNTGIELRTFTGQNCTLWAGVGASRQVAAASFARERDRAGVSARAGARRVPRARWSSAWWPGAVSNRTSGSDLWVLGSEFALLSSNKTLRRVVEEYTDAKYSGERALERPDLLLIGGVTGRHVLIESKRPSLDITREHEAQAATYRDELVTKSRAASRCS